MKKTLLTAALMLFVAGALYSAEFRIPRNINHVIVTTTTSVSTVNFDYQTVMVTITNYATVGDLYVTFDGDEPDGISNCYILGPSFERTWWISTRSVRLKSSEILTDAVGVENGW